MRLGLLAGVLLVGPAAAQSPMVTDRPDFTESAITVGAGVVQVEAGYTVEPANDLDGEAIEALARVGVRRGVELRAARTGQRRSYLGTKVHLATAPGGDLAILLGATFPFDAKASEQRFIPAVGLAGSRTTGAFSLGAMSGVAVPTSYGGPRFSQTLVVSRQLVGPVSGFAEYALEFGGDDPAIHLGHVGVALLLGPDLQLDLHAALPLGDAGSGLLGGGVAFRFR